MKNTYILRINCGQDNIKNVESILNRPSTDIDNLYWEWSILDDITPTNAYDNFLNFLSGKYDLLKKIGLDRDSISIWRHYAYDQECSLEISPEQMKNIGDQGVTLCISCWQDR